MKNFPDVFASMNPPRFLVKKADGTYHAFTEKEIAPLLSSGKIKLVSPRAMGGKIADVTQKPIMVLVE